MSFVDMILALNDSPSLKKRMVTLERLLEVLKSFLVPTPFLHSSLFLLRCKLPRMVSMSNQ